MKYFLLFLLGPFLVGCHSGEPSDAGPVVAVNVQRASVEDVPLVVTAPASIYGRNETHIASRITAPIHEVLVHRGEAVKRGQLLAVLDRSDLAAEQAEAASAVTSATAALEQAQGGRIPEQLSQAQTDLAAKTAALELATKVHERRKQLFSQGAISGKDLDVSEVAEVQAKADFDAAKTRLDLLSRQISGADLKMAQSNLVQAKAKNDLATANLSFAELRSPINGVVTDQTLYAGDMAKPDVAVLTVADLSVAVARAQVNADQASSISIGQHCTFEQKQDSAPNADVRVGKLTVVNQAVDSTRYSVEAWCEIPNGDHSLRAGLFGAVRIDVGQARAAIVVPSSAIEFEEGTNRGKAYTVDSQNVAHVHDVVAISLDDNRVRVVSGLRAGDLVIVRGEYGLPDATKVTFSEVQK